MRKEIKEWLKSKLSEREDIPFEEVYDFSYKGNPTIINSVSLGYRVTNHLGSGECQLEVWANHSPNSKVSVSGTLDKMAPSGSEWLPFLYEGVCQVIDKVNERN